MALGDEQHVLGRDLVRCVVQVLGHEHREVADQLATLHAGDVNPEVAVRAQDPVPLPVRLERDVGPAMEPGHVAVRVRWRLTCSLRFGR